MQIALDRRVAHREDIGPGDAPGGLARAGHRPGVVGVEAHGAGIVGLADQRQRGRLGRWLDASLAAKRQLAPYHPARFHQLPGDAVGEPVVRARATLVALPALGQQADASVGEAQRLVAADTGIDGDPARAEQVDLDRIPARPAGRAPDRQQAAEMDPPWRDVDRRHAFASIHAAARSSRSASTRSAVVPLRTSTSKPWSACSSHSSRTGAPSRSTSACTSGGCASLSRVP